MQYTNGDNLNTLMQFSAKIIMLVFLHSYISNSRGVSIRYLRHYLNWSDFILTFISNSDSYNAYRNLANFDFDLFYSNNNFHFL